MKRFDIVAVLDREYHVDDDQHIDLKVMHIHLGAVVEIDTEQRRIMVQVARVAHVGRIHGAPVYNVITERLWYSSDDVVVITNVEEFGTGNQFSSILGLILERMIQ